MWMRTSVTLTADQAATSGALLDLGSVNQEDDTWINGKYLGASSFGSRHYPIPTGVLHRGVNVVTTNVYCGWRDCGLRGPAETRAIRFGDNTTAPLANPWSIGKRRTAWSARSFRGDRCTASRWTTTA